MFPSSNPVSGNFLLCIICMAGPFLSREPQLVFCNLGSGWGC